MSTRIPFKLRLKFHWWFLRYGSKRAEAMIMEEGRKAGYAKGFDRGFTERHGIKWEDEPPKD